jgi:4-amino-4-deoxy-L-arabinose transferase-like glycosyltransferase
VLAVMLLLYLCLGGLYAVRTPDWQVPDEPAHYNYIRQLAEAGKLPVLEPGDYDQDYLNQLTSNRFPPELPIEPLKYEDWQPPLYYLLATPIYILFDGALTPLRLFSVLLGGGVVLLAYAVAAVVFPDQPLIPLGTAAFVAFLPQHIAMMAGVNNDSLTEFLIALALWMTLRWMSICVTGTQADRWLVGLGVALGLGLVTKASFAPVVVLAGIAILIMWWRETDRQLPHLLRHLALVFVPTLLIVMPWWARNAATYGGLDLYGMANHDAVVVGQPRTADWIQDHGWGAWLERWITFTFQSFWGQFGWMGVLMPVWLYRLLALCSLVGVVGLPVGLRQAREVASRPVIQDLQLFILGLLVVLVLLVYGYYNITFVQHQGRYLFPALIPVAIGAALAVKGWINLLRLPSQWRGLAFAAPYAALVALDVYALWRVILPALT